MRPSFVLPAISFVVAFGLWELSARLGWINTFFFSSPGAVVTAGVEEVQDPRFWNDVRFSVTTFAVGYATALAAGVVFGLLTGWYRRLAMLVDPWLTGLNATPRIALIPLVVLWLGLGQPAMMAVVFIGVFFPVALNTFHGVRTVDRTFLAVAKSFKASQHRLLMTVVVPATVPFIATAARIGVGRGVSGVVVAEFYNSDTGLAHMIFQAGQRLQIDVVIFGTLVITALAMGAFALVARIENRVAQRRGTMKG
jgi:NitT/TauT family transport system permease protein